MFSDLYPNITINSFDKNDPNSFFLLGKNFDLNLSFESIFFSTFIALNKKTILFSKTIQEPAYLTSSGVDLHADKDTVVKAGENKDIDLDLFSHIPLFSSLQIVPRSSLSMEGLVLTNSPGICDPLYQGRIKAIFSNSSKRDFIIKKGRRTAQLISLNQENSPLTSSMNKAIENINHRADFIFLNKMNEQLLFEYMYMDIEKKDSFFEVVNSFFFNNLRKEKGFGSSGV